VIGSPTGVSILALSQCGRDCDVFWDHRRGANQTLFFNEWLWRERYAWEI